MLDDQVGLRRGSGEAPADPLPRVLPGVGEGEVVPQVDRDPAVVGVADQGLFVVLTPGPQSQPLGFEPHGPGFYDGGTSTPATAVLGVISSRKKTASYSRGTSVSWGS